jgi:hypothetical protein
MKPRRKREGPGPYRAVEPYKKKKKTYFTSLGKIDAVTQDYTASLA